MSDFLFARPSVLEGIGRNIDLFGVMQEYNTSRTPAEADARALRNDLATIKRDLGIAFRQVIGRGSK